MAHDPQHFDSMSPHVKTFANWIAAALGIGTFAGLVNVIVGVLSAGWIALQIYAYLRYDLPVKRARLKAAQRGRLMDSTQPGDLG